MITQARLKELLNYDATTGVFNWAISRSVKKGTELTSIDNDGYIRVQLDYVSYRAHRLAWLWVYGEMPSKNLDHKNLVKTDNRIDNLRLATTQENNRNFPKRKNCRSIYKGVVYEKDIITARIKIDGKLIRLGKFDTELNAHQAYCLAAKKYFGEFANFGIDTHNESILATSTKLN
jgi:hypothetical protein